MKEYSGVESGGGDRGWCVEWRVVMVVCNGKGAQARMPLVATPI